MGETRRRHGFGAVGWLALVLALAIAGGGAAWTIVLLGERPPAATACPAGRCPALEAGAAAVLQPDGDAAHEQVRLEVPAGALTDRAVISLTRAPEGTAPPRALAPDGDAELALAGPIIRLEPDGLTFARPARLTVPYDPGVITEGSRPAVVHVDAGGAVLIEPATFDPDAGLVSVELAHFSDAVVVRVFGPDGVFVPPEEYDGMVERFAPHSTTAGGCAERTAGIAAAVAAGDYRIHTSPTELWGKLGTPAGERTMLWYLYAEDGGAMSSMITGADIPIRPIRTGSEAELLRLMKEHVRGGGPALTPEKLLDLGLRAAATGSGRVNLAEAVVAVHNVVRAIARSDKWWNDLTGAGGRPCPADDVDCGYDPAVHGHFGHPASDPMMPVFRDLLGAESVDGGETLYEMLGGRTDVASRDHLALMRAFEKHTGVFATLEGAETYIHNGGSHYYYWVGTVARIFHGPWYASGGKWVERLVTKLPHGEWTAGMVQGNHLEAGSAIAGCLKDDPPEPPPPPEPAPCPEPVMTEQKCPWSPDGYALRPCKPGFCYDAGPRGFLACRQIELPPGAFRNYHRRPECPPGTVPRLDRCTGAMVACEPGSVGPSATTP